MRDGSYMGEKPHVIGHPPRSPQRTWAISATQIMDDFGESSQKRLAELEYYHLNGTIYPVVGTQESLWSNLGMLLAEHNMSVLALHKRLQEKGVSVNLKSLYRLAVSQPLQKFDARIVKPICSVLGIMRIELMPTK